MLENINSGKDYAEVLINKIIEAELEQPKEEQLDSTLLKCWTNQISSAADDVYMDYIKGDRESFMFTEEEMKQLFENAKSDYIQEMLNNMVDRNLLEVSVGENGDILYGLSEAGKEYTENAKKLSGDE